MRLLSPTNKGCLSGNASAVPSSTTSRVPSVYCETLLPKKRQCIAYSFGVDGVWDYDNALVRRGCRVLSFDPFCCGASHRMAPDHDFVPIGLAPYDGLAESVTFANATYPVMTMRTIMDSYQHSKIDVLRLPVGTALEWKTLKNLINTGAVQEIRQLSLNLKMEDEDMWEEYRYILTSLRSAGFVPFYAAKQPNGKYLQVQEGTQSLHSRYEVAYGNINM